MFGGTCPKCNPNIYLITRDRIIAKAVKHYVDRLFEKFKDPEFRGQMPWSRFPSLVGTFAEASVSMLIHGWDKLEPHEQFDFEVLAQNTAIEYAQELIKTVDSQTQAAPV